ncbi:MAG: hypothetical protein HYV60_15665 [Planctomycetia bacterium]|nr:hypothetical protein [Planctomycetia bacterium]
MVREEGKDRMIIDGKGKKLRRIILEVSPKRVKAAPNENGEEGTPPGGISPEGDSGASTQPKATDPLVQKAEHYLRR